MRIALASDLHLEFGDINLKNDGNADVLILSGDICTAKVFRSGQKKAKQDLVLDFFKRVAFQFPQIVYVMGNHEHYDYDIAWTQDTLKAQLAFPNLHILEKESVTINDVTFVGATLWTDMNKGDEVTIWQVASMMNDFRCVTNSNRVVNYKTYEQINGVDNRERSVFRERVGKFSPEDAVDEFKKFTGYIQQIVEGKFDQKFVVAGHHAPSRLSTHARYADDAVMNGGYSSSLDDYIIDHPQIKLWTHGHTHHNFDYRIGSTRVVCNPRGYINYEESADRWQLITVDI